MATTRKTTVEKQEPQGSGTRPIAKRPLPFLGLFAAAPAALLTGWLLHVYLRGVDVVWTVGRYTPIDWHLSGSEAAWASTLVLLTLAGVGLSYVAWQISDSRKTPLRVLLTGSVGVAVVNLALTIGVGPARWWSFFQIVIWWIIGGIWVLPRLDVTRRDARNEEPKEDSLTEKLGLKGYLFGKPKHVVMNGEVVRTDIDVTHAPGGTIEPVQGAMPAFESLADASGMGAPSGMSTARAGAGASTSHVSLVHKDILEKGVPYELPELKPNGERYHIDERPITVGRYQDLQPATEEMRTTQGVMGTTGSGKSEYMRVKVTAMSTRSWVAPILYFDQVKGMQSAAPVLGALGVAVLSNDKPPHKAGIVAIERAIMYRADTLGRLGYDEWRPGIIDQNGDPVPKMIVWMEEADALIDGLEGKMKFISSKTRSTGIVAVWSLQRADGESMPTSVRANITSWSVFGIMPADDYSAGFALSDEVVKQGAKPFWGDTKPGYSYRAERGIHSSRWPIVRRVFRGDRETYAAITNEYGPGMMPLDRGTIAAMKGWYEQAAAEKAELAKSLTAKGMVPTVTADSQTEVKAPAAIALPKATAEPDSEAESRAIAQEIEDDIAEMKASGEIPPNPEGDIDSDPDSPISPLAPGEEDTYWGEIGGKPSARDRDEALRGLFRALQAISRDESLRDPSDPNVTVFGVTTIQKRYPFRSRPWFSTELAGVIVGETEIPAEYGVTLTVDDDADEEPYRLHRVAQVTDGGARDVDTE